MEINDFLKYFARIITLLLVLPIHEAAHALVAKKMGDDTAERQGRITLNPMMHLDPLGSLLIVLTGFGWAKPVSVNPTRMKKQRAGFALTALAGPVSNILAAFVSALIYSIILCTDAGVKAIISSEITPLYCAIILLRFIVQVNIGLAVFNLIPIPPLDGFNILSYFTGPKFDRWFYTHQREVQMGFFAFIILLNVIPAQYNPLFHVQSFFADLIWMLVDWIPIKRWGL